MKTEIQKVNRIRLTIIHCFIPIILGGLIYILFRSNTLKMFEWFSLFGVEDEIQSSRNAVLFLTPYLPDWAYFSLPDGLWVYSFTSALLIFWNNKNKFWLLFPIFTGILIEILQAFKLFRGTFDFLDLAFSILGLFLSIIIINYKFKNEKTLP